MMNAFKLVFSAAAVAVALSAGGAGAVTVSLIDHSTNGVGNQAHVFGAQFNGTTPVGSSWDAGGTPLVTPPPAVVGNAYESPFRNTPIAGSVNPRPAGTPGQSFFVSGSERATDTTLDSPKTLTFNNLQTTFTILWGSIDTYNTIAFLDSIGNTVASYTGSQIISALGLSLTPNSAGNYNEVALMTFGFGDSEAFKSVRFTSQFQGADKSAFEFALSSVPLPAGGVLMLTAFAGLAALRRRRAAA